MVEDTYKHCDKDPKLYNVKGNYEWSDKGFSTLLEVLTDVLSNNNNLPKSMYEAKKTMKVLGLEYEKIHACPNDCIMYRNELVDLTQWPNCGASRW